MNDFDRAVHLRASGISPEGEIDYLVFVNGKILSHPGSGGFLHRRSPATVAKNGAVFLGKRGGTPVISIRLTPNEVGEVAPDWSEDDLMTFRETAPLLSRDDFALVAYAEALKNWHDQVGYCARCGEETRAENFGHQRRCVSESCGYTWFPRLDPVVIMRVVREDRLLLGRHRRKRSAAFFSTIAGFVEPGETLEEAVAREVFEEVGIRSARVRYLGSQPWPLPSSLMIAFEAEAEDTDLRLDEEELLEARWFTRDELKSGEVSLPYEYSIAWRMIDAWVCRRDLV